MLEKEVFKLPEYQKNPQKLSKYNFKNEEVLYDFIKKLPTIQKIFIVQNLLKEMISIKERFHDNKQKLIDKMDSNSFKYFKNSILIKQIYDYCGSKKLEVPLKYSLSKDKIEELSKFEEENKNFVIDFFFELRNDNSLMIKIMEEMSNEYYEQLSYFIVHFLYENPTISSSSQDELILITYLIFDNFIPKFLRDLVNEEMLMVNSEDSEKKKDFLYYYFLAFTRKPEVRNYISSILYDNITELENSQRAFNLQIRSIHKSIIEEENEKLKKGTKKKNSTFNLQISAKIEQLVKNQALLHKSTLATDSDELNNDNYNANLKPRFSSDLSNLKNNKKNNNKKEQLENFFKKNDFTKVVLSKLLADLNAKKRDDLDDVYMEFLILLKNQYSKDNIEIFSNFMIAEAFKNTKINQDKCTIEEINNIYVENFEKITEFVLDIFKRINNNISSIPYILKCMLYIVNQLIKNKFSGKGRDIISLYQNYMLKIRIFIGGFILPILENPIYNGMVTDSIISNTTSDNLNIIFHIIEKFTLGNLFNITSFVNDKRDEIIYSIFNKFIIDNMPFLFKIIKNIDNDINNNFEPPIVLKNLLNNNGKTSNVNYNYFEMNKNENIRYQSICFSFSDLMMFVNTLEKINSISTKKDSNLFLLVKYKKIFNEKHLQDKKENKKEYIFLSKFSYRESFLKDIKSVTEDHFEIYFKNQNKSNSQNSKEGIQRFKKCLINILIYINILHKENFNPFIKRKDDLYLNCNSEVNKLFKFRKLVTYGETNFEDKRYSVSSLIDPILRKRTIKKALAEDTFEDADFLRQIFPRIIDNIKYEIGDNFDNKKLEKIIFCVSYLEIFIKDLPEEYRNNNFGKLFFDIMLDVEKLIKSLQNNILNQFYLKLREGDKLNLAFSNYSSQIKNLEKFVCIKYLFNSLSIKNPFESEAKEDNTQDFAIGGSPISNFIKDFPDYRRIGREIDDIIEEENKKNIPKILQNYFKEIKDKIKESKIISKFTTAELSSICYELENYILFRLHEKLFPLKQSKKDAFIYKKCCRLSFIKPENYIKEKIMINENLLKTAKEYINAMDDKFTPVDKIKMFGKAFQILQNSMTFSTGKTDLGIDDTLPSLIYIILKSQPKKINTNYNYCKNYINPELEKKEYGVLMMQIGMSIKVITEMKHTDLIGVSKEQFGNDI